MLAENICAKPRGVNAHGVVCANPGKAVEKERSVEASQGHGGGRGGGGGGGGGGSPRSHMDVRLAAMSEK